MAEDRYAKYDNFDLPQNLNLADAYRRWHGQRSKDVPNNVLQSNGPRRGGTPRKYKHKERIAGHRLD